MREIQRLRMEQEANAKTTANAQYNPTLMAELRLLRQRKDELENRMTALQDSRKDLVMQLEALMKLLKVCVSGSCMSEGLEFNHLFTLQYL